MPPPGFFTLALGPQRSELHQGGLEEAQHALRPDSAEAVPRGQEGMGSRIPGFWQKWQGLETARRHQGLADRSISGPDVPVDNPGDSRQRDPGERGAMDGEQKILNYYSDSELEEAIDCSEIEVCKHPKNKKRSQFKRIKIVMKNTVGRTVRVSLRGEQEEDRLSMFIYCIEQIIYPMGSGTFLFTEGAQLPYILQCFKSRMLPHTFACRNLLS